MEDIELLEIIKGKIRHMLDNLHEAVDEIIDKPTLKSFIQNLNQTDFKQEIIAAIQKERTDRNTRITANQQRLLVLDEAEARIDDFLT